jgi:hypothetical protein
MQLTLTAAVNGWRMGALSANAERREHVRSVNDGRGSASLVEACDDRNVSGWTCRPPHSRFCSAERFKE